VADGRDAVLDLTLIQDGPEPEVPTVLPEQRFVLDRQQPRGLVRVQVEFHLKKLVFAHLLFPDTPTYYAPATRKLLPRRVNP
jgi:hypothetical protein